MNDGKTERAAVPGTKDGQRDEPAKRNTWFLGLKPLPIQTGDAKTGPFRELHGGNTLGEDQKSLWSRLFPGGKQRGHGEGAEVLDQGMSDEGPGPQR